MTLHDRADAPQTNPVEPRQTEPAPMIITHAEMNTAYDQGLVQPLGQTVAFAVHYQGTWWINYEGGWIRTDKALADTLDAESARMTAQDALIARNAAIRAASRDG